MPRKKLIPGGGCPGPGGLIDFCVHWCALAALTAERQFTRAISQLPVCVIHCATSHTSSTRHDTMPTDRTDLLESLEKHNAAFTTLLSLIPSQYYIAPTQEEVRVEHRIAVSQAFHSNV